MLHIKKQKLGLNKQNYKIGLFSWYIFTDNLFKNTPLSTKIILTPSIKLFSSLHDEYIFWYTKSHPHIKHYFYKWK